jgi:hypothetical protein
VGKTAVNYKKKLVVKYWAYCRMESKPEKLAGLTTVAY